MIRVFDLPEESGGRRKRRVEGPHDRDNRSNGLQSKEDRGEAVTDSSLPAGLHGKPGFPALVVQPAAEKNQDKPVADMTGREQIVQQDEPGDDGGPQKEQDREGPPVNKRE